MFDDLSGMDWLVILTALVLGFGIVRFVISAVEDRGNGLPGPIGPESPREPDAPAADSDHPPHGR